MERKSNKSKQKRPNRRKVQGMAGPQTRREAAFAANPIPAQKGFNALSVRGIPLFPIRFKAMLRYYEAVSISTSGTVGAYVFSANGLFDPNITGTGHQPMGFDQIMLSYEHYCVLQARINVVAQNTSTTGTPQIVVQLAASNTVATLSQAIMEQGQLAKVHLTAGPGYGCSQQLKQAIRIGKFLGIPNVLDNPDCIGTVAANPVEQEYFHIYGWDDNAQTSTVNLDVTIEYEAMFIEPKKLTQSLITKLHELNERKTDDVVVLSPRSVLADDWAEETCYGHVPLPLPAERAAYALARRNLGRVTKPAGFANPDDSGKMMTVKK